MPSFILTASTVAKKSSPVARLTVSSNYTVLGSIVSLDGRQSQNEDGSPLTYSFSFLTVPIGSKVEREGFRSMVEDGSMVSFSPDVVGEYVVGLRVDNEVMSSAVVQQSVDVRAILVPHARGIVPDGKFIWSYLRDVWTQVDGKEFFETLWSALIQISGAELLKLYQNDWNKSIRDIQDYYQRRWLSYEPELKLKTDELSFILGRTMAGRDATTGIAGEIGLAVPVSANELRVVRGSVRPDLAGKTINILYSRNELNVGEYKVSGLTPKTNGIRLASLLPKNPTNTDPSSDIPSDWSDLVVKDTIFNFDLQSTTWTLGDGTGRVFDYFMTEYQFRMSYKGSGAAGADKIRAGDVIVVPAGVNAGLYTILEVSGSSFVVDHAPPGASTSDGTPVPSSVYRPMGFFIPAENTDFSDILSIPLSDSLDTAQFVPGKVIVVNGQSHVIARTSIDRQQRVPFLVIALEQPTAMSGVKGASWLLPHTMVSTTVDFEQEGVRTGDVLTGSVLVGEGATAQVSVQVAGVSKNRLGFVFSVEPLETGVAPATDPSLLSSLSKLLGIESVIDLPDGTQSIRLEAQELLRIIGSAEFGNAFLNYEMPAQSEIQVGKRAFTLLPRSVIRNKLLPLDSQVRSIPALQEYIQQPSVIEENGKLYRDVRGVRFEMAQRPIVARERREYVVDDELALSDELAFQTGTDDIITEGGDFIDSGVSPGDLFVIDSPAQIAGEYPILRVLDRDRLKLSVPVPLYPLSDVVTAKVRVMRSVSGRFLRFIPGLFTPKSPAPARFWAEVTFFDNADAIENNFGVLVGLRKQDLEDASSNAPYRQAVAGLMYSYAHGPSVDTIRLGASLLLGLPFTEARGIIRSIETDYRKNANGEPTMGRILIEDVDSEDAPLGVSRVYTYPVDSLSELSGVETNPATKLPYSVGDIVPAFSLLAKGVKVDDFQSTRNQTWTASKRLQQMHSARFRINDNIFQPSEIGLVSSFLRKITPSYIAVAITTTTETADRVVVQDKLRMRSRNSAALPPIATDFAGFWNPVPLAFDLIVPHGNLDVGPTAWRRGGRDLNIVSGILTVVAGGLLSPRSVEEVFEAPLCQPGDLLVIGGKNFGTYHIQSLTNSTIVVSDPPADGWDNESGVSYAVMRPLRPKVLEYLGDATAGVSTVLGPSLRTYGVAPGDWAILEDNGSYSRHVVRAVAEGVAGSGIWNILTITPAPLTSQTQKRVLIYRPTLFGAQSEEVFEILSTGQPNVLSDLGELVALADPGDELVIFEELVLGSWTAVPETRVLIFDPALLFVSPTLPAGSYRARLVKNLYQPFHAGWDSGLGFVKDEIVVSMRRIGSDATVVGQLITLGALPDPAASGVRPGDLLTLSGNVSGTYPITAVTATTVEVSSPPGNGTAAWRISRRT